MKNDFMIGKTIAAILFDTKAKEDVGLRFADGTTARGGTYRDCCSGTWIENIENVTGAIGGKITAVEDVFIDGKQDPQHDWLQSYAFRIELEGRPPLLIEYRNSSNGYYGGSIYWDPDPVDCLTEITEDV